MKKDGFILMLENDQHDRELSKEYFDKLGIDAEFLIYSNALLPLLQTRYKENAALPRVILISSNAVPDKDLTVLEQVKSNPAFKHIPVVILCEYSHPDLVTQYYAAGANTVISKPFTDETIGMKIQTFIQYWFDVAEAGTIRMPASQVI